MKLLLAIVFFLMSCSHLSTRLPASDETSSEEINSENRFSFGADAGNGFYKLYIKFAVVLDDQKNPQKVIFQNTKAYPYHQDFLRTWPGWENLTSSQFDEITLKEDKRKIILGVLLDSMSDSFGFDLISLDEVPPQKILKIQTLLDGVVKEGREKSIQYYPSSILRQIAEQNAERYRSLGIRLLLEVQTENRTVYTVGWSAGKLRFVKAEDIENHKVQIATDDFLIVDRVPRDLPSVAGVITAVSSSPASHVALLAEMYKIPFAYVKGAFTKAEYRALENKNIYYEASRDFMQEIDPQSFNLLRKWKEPRVSKQPEINRDEKNLRSVTELTFKELPAYGGKATQLGIMKNILPNETPEIAIAIPVFYFGEFLKQAKASNGESLESFVNKKIEEANKLPIESAEVTAAMTALRKEMENAKVPDSILQKINSGLKAHFTQPTEKLKIRSSSNAEDLNEFNGAGLYDSEGCYLSGLPADSKKTLERALKKVWASLYTDRGYRARRLFKINESGIAMGLLAQRSYQNEQANGVALVAKSWDIEATFTGFPGEDLEVTHPPVGKRPEIAVVRMSTHEGREANLQRVQESTETTPGRPVLTDKEYLQMGEFTKKVYVNWPDKKPLLVLDFEWKKTAEGKLALKQVRPVPPNTGGFFGVHEDDFIFPSTSYDSKYYEGENQHPLQSLFAPKRFQFQSPVISRADLKTKKITLKNVVVQYLNQTYRYETLPANFEITAWNDESGWKRRDLKLIMNVQHPIFGTVAYTALFNQSLDPQKPIPERIFFFGDSGLRGVIADKKKWAELPFGHPNENWDLELMSPEYGRMYDAYRRIPLVHTFQGKKWKMKIETNALRNPTGQSYDKTFFEEVTKITIVDSQGRSAVISGARRSVYTPFHHNFSWYYGSDLKDMPNTIPELKNIRYLVYKYTGHSGEEGKPTIIYAFTEDGTSKVVEEGLITLQKTF